MKNKKEEETERLLMVCSVDILMNKEIMKEILIEMEEDFSEFALN